MRQQRREDVLQFAHIKATLPAQMRDTKGHIKEGNNPEGDAIHAEPFVQNVLSIFMPGILLSVLLFFTNQVALALVIAIADISFVVYLISQRCGVANKMTYKRGVSFNLRHMLQSPSNLLIQRRGLVAIRFLVENKDKSERVTERGGIAILLNTMRRFPDDHSIQNDVLRILRIIGEKHPVARRRIFKALDCKTELTLRFSHCKTALAYPDTIGNKSKEELEGQEILKNLLFLMGTLVDGSNNLMVSFRTTGIFEVLIDLLESTAAVPKIAYAVCWVLYQSQSGCDDKVYLSTKNTFQATLDIMRMHKQDEKLNLMGAMLIFEMLFKHVEEQSLESSGGLQFLPDVYAEALEAGVFQALVDLSTRRKNLPQLSNMIHTLKAALAKERETSIGDRFEIIDM